MNVLNPFVGWRGGEFESDGGRAGHCGGDTGGEAGDIGRRRCDSGCITRYVLAKGSGIVVSGFR